MDICAQPWNWGQELRRETVGTDSVTAAPEVLPAEECPATDGSPEYRTLEEILNELREQNVSKLSRSKGFMGT